MEKESKLCSLRFLLFKVPASKDRTQPNATERFRRMEFRLQPVRHWCPSGRTRTQPNDFMICRDIGLSHPLSLGLRRRSLSRRTGLHSVRVRDKLVSLWPGGCPESNKTERFHKSFRFGPRCTNDLRRRLYKSFHFGFGFSLGFGVLFLGFLTVLFEITAIERDRCVGPLELRWRRGRSLFRRCRLLSLRR